ncbi:MAG: glucuronate isomerase [Cyclobacteriaceae bacterium]|nr:glucuronate isomerase [Cyclobacteriaceae bacterium]
MKKFLDKNFILENATAETLYHEHAAKMPIIDYHCHLSPEDIAKDRKFENLTKVWLDGDHYKWRAMRTNGIDEKYITGSADDFAKFEKWAETVPYTMRNPLYHWTHMELQQPFGIHEILNAHSARKIYEEASAKLQQDDFSCRGLLRQFKVEVVCTTDDPVDSLEHHQAIKASGFPVKVLPTFRPDKAMAVEDPQVFNAYIDKLSEVTNMEIGNFNQLIDAIQSRHDFFDKMGGKLSDHGLEQIYAEDFYDHEIKSIFNKIRSGHQLDNTEMLKFKSAMLVYFGIMDHAKGWTQQFHLGALRNNNSRMVKKLGADTGFDSIGDFEMGRPISRFLDKLDSENQLAKTILYNLNPRDNYLIGTMIGNFNDGSIPGKVNFGTGWWFLDQKEGMEMQINALSNLGLLSRFLGMLTDSRSFLSYPRHDYFRRILCNMIGKDVENGELPNDLEWLGKMVENISYNNAKGFFGF